MAVERPNEVAAALSGDSTAFATLTERYRRALHLHCYRLLASFDEAEDAVQECLLRAWRSRASFDGSALFRAWLYRIATHVCLDMLRHRSRLAALYTVADLPWLQPYPDQLLDELAAQDDGPDTHAVEQETIEIAFLTAMQALPPRQRAVFVGRDVLGWSASDTASLLDMSVAAANSALQRARMTMQKRLPSRRGEWKTATPTAQERAILAQFIAAHERCDTAAALALASEEICVAMPPYPMYFKGRDQLVQLLERAFGPQRDGEWRLLPTRANRMPAAASYLQRPGDSTYRAFKLDVLRIVGGSIAEITTFGPSRFPYFGLSATL